MSHRRVSAKIGSVTRFNKKYKPSLKNEYTMIKNRKAVNRKAQQGSDEAQNLQYEGDDPRSEDSSNDQQDINQLATMKYKNQITSLSIMRGERGQQKNTSINQADQIDIQHKIRLNRQLNIVIWSLFIIISVLLFSHYQFRLLSQSQLLIVHGSAAKASYAPVQTNLQQNFGKQPKQLQSTTDKKQKNQQEQVSKQPKTMQEQFMESDKKEDDKEDAKQNEKLYERADIREIKQGVIKKQTINEISAQMKNQIKGSPSLTPPQFSTQPKKQETGPIKYRNPAPPPNQKYSKSLDLKDFSNDFVYQQAPEDIKQILTEMIRRPADKRSRPNSIFMPSQKAYFAYRLFKNPDNQFYEKAQLYYYDQKYRISQYVEQMELCVVAPGRNIVTNGKYKRFVDSIQRQNYTHYRLVYIDDLSDDNSAEKLQQYIKSTKGFLTKIDESNEIYEGSFIIDKQTYRLEEDPRRLIIVKNTERIYALANRNQGIRQYCPQNSIVLDVDADDAIIGKQAFKLINAVYHDPEVWMFNSVFIYDKSIQRQVTTGPQQGVPQQLLQNNQYRTGSIWRTSQLRTFKTKLFNKINENDFKDENGVFYKWASDVFVQMPLVELAGPKHYKHLYQILYFYDWDFNRTTIYKRRHYRDIAFMQTPYKPLQSLEDDAEKLQNYVVPDRIRVEYEKNIKQAKAEAQRYGRSEAF